MRFALSKRNLVYVTMVVAIFIFSTCLMTNPVLFHGAYSVIDDSVCLSRVSEQLNVEPKWSAVTRYIEVKLKAGMFRDSVHRVFKDIAPIAVTPYKNYQGEDYEEIIVLMCSEPLNNLVFDAAYTFDGKLISINQEDSP